MFGNCEIYKNSVTFLSAREDGDDLVAFPFLWHRGQRLGAVIGWECVVFAAAAEIGATHPYWGGRGFVLVIPVVTHDHREQVSEEAEHKRETEEMRRGEENRRVRNVQRQEGCSGSCRREREKSRESVQSKRWRMALQTNKNTSWGLEWVVAELTVLSFIAPYTLQNHV